MIGPNIYPMGLLDPLVLAQARASVDLTSDSNTHFVAKDTLTGEMVGISWWQTFVQEGQESLQSGEEGAYLQVEMEKAWNTRPKVPDVPGTNEELAKAYFEATFAARWGVKRPFMELKMLAVHPNYQGRGVGSLLLRDGLEKADEMSLPVFVNSAVQGQPLYERYGFGDAKKFPLDCRDYGGFAEGKHWTMLRPARA